MKKWRTLEFTLRIPVYAEKVNQTAVSQTMEEAINNRPGVKWPINLQVGRARITRKRNV